MFGSNARGPGMKGIAMKPALIVALSFLFTNFAMAEGIIVGGKDLKDFKGYTAVSDQYFMFWLPGEMAEYIYAQMKEEIKDNIAECTGTIKQFPGFLCSKNGNIFECFIQINTKNGMLEGDTDNLCKHQASITQRMPLTAWEIFSGNHEMHFHLIGSTAKALYNKMDMKPIYNNPNSCAGGLVKYVEGLDCGKYKNKHTCYMGISLETKNLVAAEMCPQE
jgi:hypothetical protein